jgi:hypothetical protein
MSFKPVQAQRFALAGSGCSSTDTSIVLASFKLPAGTLITMADFGTIGFITIEPGTSREENISFTGVTQNVNKTATLTGVTRGLGFIQPYAETAGNKFAHAGGAVTILSNNASFYENLFPQVVKDYVDNASYAGTVNGDETTKGIFEEATQAEVNAGTATGSTGASLVVTADKFASFIGSFLTIETTTGTTHSLTTTAGEKVIVIAKGDVSGVITANTFLKYNGVTKDTVNTNGGGNSGARQSFCLQYTETPGAATQNITVTTDTSISNVVIIVMKIGI